MKLAKQISQQEQIEQLYAEAHFATANMIEKLRVHLFDMPSPDSDGLTWGNLANLNELKRQIANVVEFVESCET